MDKITVHRGMSRDMINEFEDEQFDMVYIDGNHNPDYALEDAVLYFRKLKVGGHMIFDDYGWGGPDMTQRGIDSFIHAYFRRLRVIGERNSQVFVQKIN
jgi:predicted O-methyltransferase YrrM